MEEDLIQIETEDETKGEATESQGVQLDQRQRLALEQETDCLSLPAFRMMCLSNPLLDAFFSSQLPASFILEVPHRTSINGISIWHDIPSTSTITSSGSPRVAQGAPASAPASRTSFSTAPSSPTSARAYSKDISTGVVGRLGGFLNNFLGEEVKSKVDELADSLGEKLNTKVVKGPLPSFANLNMDQGPNISAFGGAMRREKSTGTLGMDDLRALEEQRQAKRRIREQEELQEEQEAKAAREKRGIDINAAQKSLRMATESIVEGTQTGGKQFRDDVPVLAETDGNGEEEEEEEEVGIDEEVVQLSKA